MSKIAFIDLDGVIVKPGTHELLPSAKIRLQKLHAEGYEICFFSCWGYNQDDLEFLASLGIASFICLNKPLADEYIFIDDRLNIEKCSKAL